MSVMVAEYLTLAIWGMKTHTKKISETKSEASSMHSAFHDYQWSPPHQSNTNNILNFYSEIQQTTHRHEGTFTSVTAHFSDSQNSSLYTKEHLQSTDALQAIFMPHSRLPPYIYN